MRDVMIKQQNPKTIIVISVTFVCMLLFMLNNGVRSNFGLISTALCPLTGLPAEDISFAVAIAQLLYGFSQPFFGILALRRSNSFVLGLGAVLLGAGLLALPFCQSVIMLYLSLGVLVGLAAGALAFGVIMGAASPVLGEKHAATASGIINGAGGLGGAILAPVLQQFDTYGMFPESMVGLACIACLAALACVWLGRKERRAEKELGEEAEIAEDRRLSMGALLKEGLTSKRFMHVALAFFTCGFFMAIIETYLYPQMLSYGFDATSVAFMFTIYGIMGTIGPVITGFLSGRVDPKFVLGVTYGLRPVFVVMFLLLPKSMASAYLFIVGIGLTGNATVPPTTLLIMRFFGDIKMPTLSGLAMVLHQIGSFASTWLASYLIMSTGSYIPIWLCAAALACVASWLCFAIK